jgi:ribonuclease VapC
MIFADASALIAIIAGEPEADMLADLLEADRLRLCSALSVWETVAGLCRSYTFSVPAARTHIGRFLETGNFQFVGIGKGRHPAALNMGDCYAYACTKANRAKLLFKGDDFTKTDMTAAR